MSAVVDELRESMERQQPRDNFTLLDARIQDYLTWFTANHDRWEGIVDPKKQIEFLDLAVGGSIHLIHLLHQEVKRLAGHRTYGQIWTPPEWVQTRRRRA